MRDSDWRKRLAAWREKAGQALAARPSLRWTLPAACVAVLALALAPGLAGLQARSDPVDPEPAAPPAAEAWDPAPANDTEMLPAEDPLVELAAIPAPEPAAFPDPSPADPAGAEMPPDTESYDCIVEPSELIEIGSPVEGLIERIYVERGDLIETGQTLVELESGVEKAQVKLAQVRARMVGAVRAREAEVALQQRREDRVTRLYDSQALSLDLREQVETEAEIARRELEEAHDGRQLASLQLEQMVAVLRRRQIRSPVEGVVVDRLMSAGEVVDDETILVLAQIDPLRVEVVMPAARFGSVSRGMRAAVELELPGERVYVASVVVVDRIIDAASGTFGVWLELPNPEAEIPGGLNCRARFLIE